MGFDPNKFKKKGNQSFGVTTEKDGVDTSAEQVARDEQDLLVTRLNQSKRKGEGSFLLPTLLPITGKQVELYGEALQSLGVNASLDPNATYEIDRTGFCPELCGIGTEGLDVDYLKNNFVIVSPDQNTTSIVNPQYSFLSDLLDRIYLEQGQTIKTFTKGEALIGNINNKVIQEGVERFLREGDYKEQDAIDVDAKIHTSMDALSKLDALFAYTKKIEAIPEYVTDRATISEYYVLAGELKDRYKKLTDLVLPSSVNIHHGVDCFRYEDSSMELYYFKTDGKPLFVFFAPDGEASNGVQDFMSSDYIILNGNDHSRLLNNLMDIGMVDYLVEHVESVRDSYAPKTQGVMGGLAAMTGGESELPPEWHRFNDITSTLRISSPDGVVQKIAEGYQLMGSSDNLENVRGQYVRSLSADVKAQMVFPRTEKSDRLVCDLISRTFPSEALKTYGFPAAFGKAFVAADDEAKVAMLKEVNATMRFTNQNDLLVNRWISKNYADHASQAGIKFE